MVKKWQKQNPDGYRPGQVGRPSLAFLSELTGKSVEELKALASGLGVPFPSSIEKQAKELGTHGF